MQLYHCDWNYFWVRLRLYSSGDRRAPDGYCRRDGFNIEDISAVHTLGAIYGAYCFRVKRPHFTFT